MYHRTVIKGKCAFLFHKALSLSEVVETKVGDFNHKSAVNNTVGALQVAMTSNIRAVDVRHALEEGDVRYSITYCPHL